MMVGTLGHLLALQVTPRNHRDGPEVGRVAEAIQVVIEQSVEANYIDQGYTGERPTTNAKDHGIALKVIKLPEAKGGLVLLLQR